jgi:hypothetical protein
MKENEKGRESTLQKEGEGRAVVSKIVGQNMKRSRR